MHEAEAEGNKVPTATDPAANRSNTPALSHVSDDVGTVPPYSLVRRTLGGSSHPIRHMDIAAVWYLPYAKK